MFTEYFSTVYSDRNCPVPPEIISKNALNIYRFDIIAISESYNCFSNTNINKSPGPDSILPLIYLDSCRLYLM